MKNSHRLLTLALSLAAPALATWLLAGREFSADLLFGTYTLAGLCFLTATDYLPHRTFAHTPATRKPSRRWIRASLGRFSTASRAHREEKLLA